MECSFKANYEKKTNADGSVELVFPESRLNAGVIASGAAGNFAAVFLIIPSCVVVTSPVLIINSLGDWAWLMSAPLWVAGTWYVTAKLYSKIFSTKGRITVIPGEGIKFAGKQLPFSEIKELATMTEQLTGGRSGQIVTTAYVYATAHGQEVRLTRNLSENLASTLVSEVVSASGGHLT